MTNRMSNGVAMGWTGLLLAGSALHWLITPIDHPGASATGTALVYAELMLGLVLAFLGWRAAKRERKVLGGSWRRVSTTTTVVMAGAVLVGISSHWLITPINHPQASTTQTVMAWTQIALGGWLVATPWRRQRSLTPA